MLNEFSPFSAEAEDTSYVPSIANAYQILHRAAYLAGVSYSGRPEIQGTLLQVNFFQGLDTEYNWEATGVIIDVTSKRLYVQVDLYSLDCSDPELSFDKKTHLARGLYRLETPEEKQSELFSLRLPSMPISIRLRGKAICRSSLETH